MSRPGRLLVAAAAVAAGRGAYRALVDGRLTLDLGVGRRTRPLGPRTWTIAAPRELVFDVLAAPYAERPPRALREKVQIWERSGDAVLAAHVTHVRGRPVRTVELVRLGSPGRIDFRLLRGPVPHVDESFELEEQDGTTILTWRGELGTDLGPVGAWWGDRVAAAWERAVSASVEAAGEAAEARAGRRSGD